MFVVRRAFRGPKGPQPAGSVIEPADIKYFRYHLQQKHIVEVTEHNFERYKTFFKQRFGIEIEELQTEDDIVVIVPEKEPEKTPVVAKAVTK